MASIARTYDCSPPAISYVVSRSRARQPEPETAARPLGGPEPQLIKASAPDGAIAAAKPPMPALSTAEVAPNGHHRTEAAIVPSDLHRDPHPPHDTDRLAANGEHRAGPAANGPSFAPALPDRPQAAVSPPQPTNGVNGGPHPVAATNGDRRTLHLSLGSPSHRNGGAPLVDTPQPERPVPPEHKPPSLPPAAGPRNDQNGVGLNGFSDIPPNGYPEHARRNDPEIAPRKNAGSFIDLELRARVDGDIAVFLAAFDAALAQDTQENRAALREATDRLLRAGARTRIELERLEARLPLPPRENPRSSDAAWRHR